MEITLTLHGYRPRWTVIFLMFALKMLSATSYQAQREAYRCDEDKGTCQRTVLPATSFLKTNFSAPKGSQESATAGSLPAASQKYTWSWTLRVCQLRCGSAGSLWPLPTGDVDLSRNVRQLVSSVDSSAAPLAKLQLRRDCSSSMKQSVHVRRLLRSVEATLRQRLSAELPSSVRRGRRMGRTGRRGRLLNQQPLKPALLIEICVTSDDITLDWETDEKYLLHAFPQADSGSFVVRLVADSIWGARNGVETLAQLITWDEAMNSLVIVDGFVIRDAPAYPHRGLLVDSTRNFLPIAKLRDIIIDMAQNKLNVLHWHLTDSQSFPYDSPSIPALAATGAYSKKETYSSADVRALVRFAWARGVRVLPEVDAPAHAAAGWTWGPAAGLGLLVVCAPPGKDSSPWISRCIEPPCGQMNPANHHLYPLLTRLFADLLRDLKAGGTPATVFHMGGDEVHMGCWNSSTEIVTFLKKELNRSSRNRADFLALWGYFQKKATAALDAAVIGVDSDEVDTAEGVEEATEPDNALWEDAATDTFDALPSSPFNTGANASKEERTSIPVILWTSELTSPAVIRQHLDPNRYVIQTWLHSGDPIARSLVSMGYRIIVSTKDAWYLDHGYGNWKGNSTSGYPYHPWQAAYDNDPSREVEDIELSLGQRLVLGGEAALWGEQVDAAGLEAKMWPRAAAVAERLWSGKAAGNWREARIRMVRHRDRMVRHGTPSEALQPHWCTQHEGECY